MQFATVVEVLCDPALGSSFTRQFKCCLLFVMLQDQEVVSHWDAWVCGVRRLEREACDLQLTGLHSGLRISNEGPQPEE